MNFNSVNEILDFAVQKEEEAAEFYTALAAKMDQANMKSIFQGFAEEEKGHKAKLLAIKGGKVILDSEKEIVDLQIGDHLEEIKLNAEVSYQDALIVAMKAEKAAFRLYSELAGATKDAGLKDALMGLANEEAKHKLRFEVEYDDFILTEN